MRHALLRRCNFQNTYPYSGERIKNISGVFSQDFTVFYIFLYATPTVISKLAYTLCSPVEIPRTMAFSVMQAS